MAGGKETPRQKMIGLMYLVLTAMLALNVSKAILKGFVSVNDNLEKTKENLTRSNKLIADAFKSTIDGNPKAAPYYAEAMTAQKDLNEMFKYVDEVKGNFMGKCIKWDEKNGKVLGDTIHLKYMGKPWYDVIDNYDVPMQVLIGTNKHNPNKGPLTAYELKTKLEALHTKLVAQLDKMQKTDGLHLLADDYNGLKSKLDVLKPVASGVIEDKRELTWEEELTDHLPMGAVFVNMNTIQANIKAVESEILNVFSSASGKLSIKPDRLSAMIIAPSAYISQGSKYTSEVFLGASFDKLPEGDMEVLVGVDSAAAVKGAKGNSIKVENGRGQYEIGTSALGDQKYSGVIKFKKPDGTFEYYPFQGEYKVAPSALSISADQMNVFYVGVENPISVGVAGRSPQDVSIVPTGGGVKVIPGKSAGQYSLTFTSPGTCSITAMVKDAGKMTSAGVKVFKIKPLPKPEPRINGIFSPLEMKKAELGLVSSIAAGASGFDFKANYVVTKYAITAKAGSIKVVEGTGSALSSAAVQLLQKADVGSKIYVDLDVRGPDGKITTVTHGIKVAR
ncbi:MAG: hypothetical protein KF900_07790 [Bacteroidetes bacterium]|nr:hypothetical protein [Bacteroidota bacterium]